MAVVEPAAEATTRRKRGGSRGRQRQLKRATVWTGFGIGYGLAPLILPIAAITVLRARLVVAAQWQRQARPSASWL